MRRAVDDEWVREAERLHRRYLVEVVEAFGLCPWAERARLDGKTHVSILLEADETALEASMAVLDRWGHEQAEIGFLVYPRLPLGRLEFDGFVARLRLADAERHGLGGAPFALATFHPDAEPDLGDAERLVPFLRRTPDACVQAVSMTALERVRRGTLGGTQFVDIAAIEANPSGTAAAQSLRERIARANLETVRRAGVESLRACFEGIRRDRARTYEVLAAREGLPPPAPASHPHGAARSPR
jgi:hypothetical protein